MAMYVRKTVDLRSMQETNIPQITTQHEKIIKRVFQYPYLHSLIFNLTARTLFCRVHLIVNVQRQCAASMCSDACPNPLILGDVENSKHIMAGLSIRFDIGTRSFLVRIHDNLTPVFWYGA